MSIVGGKFAMTLDENGNVQCWGTENRINPPNLNIGRNGQYAHVVAISVIDDDTCLALLSDGTIKMWSTDHVIFPTDTVYESKIRNVKHIYDDEFGDDFEIENIEEIKVDVAAIPPRIRNLLIVVRTDGSISLSYTFDKYVISNHTLDKDVIAVAAGEIDVLFLLRDGKIKFQTIQGTNLDLLPDTTRDFTQIGLRRHRVLAIAAGQFIFAILLDNRSVKFLNREFMRIFDHKVFELPVIAIACSDTLFFVLLEDGTVRCFNQMFAELPIPEELYFNDVVVRSIAGGTDYLMALRSNGTVMCWRYSANNQPIIFTDLVPPDLVLVDETPGVILK